MPGKLIQPWIVVRTWMEDWYRETVIFTALNHLVDASPDLRLYAQAELTRGLELPGSRIVKGNLDPVVRSTILSEIRRVPIVATAVICLWAEAERSFIEAVRQSATAAGFEFEPEWDWEDARRGFVDETHQQTFVQWRLAQTREMDKVTAQNYHLASLWLSRALLKEPEPLTGVPLPLVEPRSVVELQAKPKLTPQKVQEIKLESKEESLSPENLAVLVMRSLIKRKAQGTRVAPESDENVLVSATEPIELEHEAVEEELSELEALPAPVLGEMRAIDETTQPITLMQISQILQSQHDQVRQAQTRALLGSQELVRLIQQPEILAAMDQNLTLQKLLMDFQQESGSLKKLVSDAVERIDIDLDARPDLNEPRLAQGAEYSADLILAEIERILEYDDQKKKVLEEASTNLAECAQLRVELAGWVTDETLQDRATSPNYESEPTLTQARQSLLQTRQQLQSLQEQRSQLREQSINRIMNTIIRLREFGLDESTPIYNSQSLNELAGAELTKFDSKQLRALEAALTRRLDEQIVIAQAAQRDEIATALQTVWDEATLLSLLNSLVEHRREVEVVLLLIAANRVHPRQENITLERKLITGVLYGVEQLSLKANRFGLLNLIGPDLCQRWIVQDVNAQTELCLVFLAAAYRGSFHFPSNFLWGEVALEWPIQEMASWKRLWESVIYGDPIPILQQNVDIQDKLSEAQNQATGLLQNTDGIFLRASSARKSTRHMHLLNHGLLPILDKHLQALKACDGFLHNPDEIQGELIVSQLDTLQPGIDQGKFGKSIRKNFTSAKTSIINIVHKYLNEDLPNLCQQETLVDLYEKEATEAGVKDPDPFHRRNVIGVLEDCAQGLAAYGKALNDYWENENARQNHILSSDLRDELSLLPELTPLGQAAFENILQGFTTAQDWDESAVHKIANEQVAYQLLSQATFALRLPRLVSHLVRTRLGDWENTLRVLLDDLASPMNKVQAAEYLLEAVAPNQALLLAESIPLELQKQAQVIKREQEREIEGLQADLLKLGGDIEVQTGDYELGRWGLLRQELTQRVMERRAATDEAKRQAQEKARKLMVALNDIGMELFDHANVIGDAYDFVQEGINLARSAASKQIAMDQVETFIKEIQYRRDHSAWSVLDIQQMNNSLDQAISGAPMQGGAALSTENILSLFEQGEMNKLRLRPDQLLPATINTRMEVLGSWLRLSKHPGMWVEDISIAQRENITGFFSHFAQMTSMRRIKTLDNKPLEFNEPLVYSYWALQYPRAHALKENCVLMALPGSTINADDLNKFTNFLIEKKLMTLFVLVFLPGGNLKIHKRLQNFYDQNYSEKRLVLIDDATMIKMVLAEADGLIPLDRLRPLMLSASRVNIDIFKYNNDVDSHMEIFVGRKTEIERIASSSENFAVYGGRRIGKSSLLKAIQNRLERRGIQVIYHSFEGEDCAEDPTASKLAALLSLNEPVSKINDFKLALQNHFKTNPETRLVLLLDEIDKYIDANPDRHTLIEILRSVSNEFNGQFRIVIAGFMGLYDCLKGRGPYTSNPTSDPWARFLNDMGPLGNLKSLEAEEIVKEGFIGVLGWSFENRAIPQKIVELTGSHPAFVQRFCSKIQDCLASRSNKVIQLEDIRGVYDDNDPGNSFISYAQKTLDMNLIDPVSKYLIVWLAAYYSDAQSFTLDQLRELASQTEPKIPDDKLQRSLEKMVVTSVVRERSAQVYEFSVRDYPAILSRLGETANLEKLEEELKKYLLDTATHD